MLSLLSPIAYTKPPLLSHKGSLQCAESRFRHNHVWEFQASFPSSGLLNAAQVQVLDKACSPAEQLSFTCMQVLEKVRGTKNVDAEYEDILEACDISHAIAGKWKVLFTRKYRPVLTGSGEDPLVLCQGLPVGPILFRLCTGAFAKQLSSA